MLCDSAGQVQSQLAVGEKREPGWEEGQLNTTRCGTGDAAQATTNDNTTTTIRMRYM